MKILNKCVCGSQFETTKARQEQGRGKFCSKKCQYANATRPSGLKYELKVVNKAWIKKGQRLPQAEWTEERRQAQSERLKGKRNSPSTEFRKGVTPWNKGKEHMADGQHPNWRGDEVGYNAIHTWIQRKLGKPGTCKECGRNGLKGKKIHWANISGNYMRDASDWIRLCAKCHRNYDLGNMKLTCVV